MRSPRRRGRRHCKLHARMMASVEKMRREKKIYDGEWRKNRRRGGGKLVNLYCCTMMVTILEEEQDQTRGHRRAGLGQRYKNDNNNKHAVIIFFFWQIANLLSIPRADVDLSGLDMPAVVRRLRFFFLSFSPLFPSLSTRISLLPVVCHFGCKL